MKWNHVGIKTADLDRSLDFYCNCLGLEKKETIKVLDRDYFFVGNDTISIELEPCGPNDAQADMRIQSGLYHMAFTVLDLEGLAKKLESRGVKFILPVSQFRADRKIAFIEDPDGVFIQLIEYL
jgi:lactoylglutathione lyase